MEGEVQTSIAQYGLSILTEGIARLFTWKPIFQREPN